MVIRPTSYIGSRRDFTQDPANLQLWVLDIRSGVSAPISSFSVKSLQEDIAAQGLTKFKANCTRMAIGEILKEFSKLIQDVDSIRSIHQSSSRQRDKSLFYPTSTQQIALPVYQDYGAIYNKLSGKSGPGAMLVQSSLNQITQTHMVSDALTPADFWCEASKTMFECFLENPESFAGPIKQYYDANLLRGYSTPGNKELLITKIYRADEDYTNSDLSSPELEILSLLQEETVEHFQDRWSEDSGHSTVSNGQYQSYFCNSEPIKRVVDLYLGQAKTQDVTNLCFEVISSVSAFECEMLDASDIDLAGGLNKALLTAIESANDEASEGYDVNIIPVEALLTAQSPIYSP